MVMSIAYCFSGSLAYSDVAIGPYVGIRPLYIADTDTIQRICMGVFIMWDRAYISRSLTIGRTLYLL